MSIRNGIIVTVAGGLAVYALTQGFGQLKKLASLLWLAMAWIGDVLASSYSIPGWAILIGGILALVGVAGIGIALLLRFSTEKPPAYLSYTEDEFYGARWRWAWSEGTVVGLGCFCPTCDAELVVSQGYAGAQLVCEVCSNRTFDLGGYYRAATDRIQREIRRRVRTGQAKCQSAGGETSIH